MGIRDIIFRGKRTDNGEWVYGDLEQIPSQKWCGISLQNSLKDVYTVDPNTVGQYTGLLDSTGRRIFENDILRLTCEADDFEWIAIVKFGNPNGEYNWGFQLDKLNGDGVATDILLWVEMDGADAEKIGNIYDDLELLK